VRPSVFRSWSDSGWGTFRLILEFPPKYELDAFNLFNHASFATPRSTTSLYNST
jgi:hypothetical protein